MNASRIDGVMARIRIDQLIANELCETSRAELIGWLEESKERWRELGLAYLESQIWTNSLAELESQPAVATSTVVSRTEPKENSLKRLGMGLVMAASLLLTFFGGVKWAAHSSYVYGDNDSLAQVTQGGSGRSMTADKDVRNTENQASAVQHPKSVEISAYRKNASGTLEKVRMPVTTVMSASRSGAATERLLRSLEDRGFTVSTEQRFVPATMSDGREVMLPFEQVMARYVGRNVY